MKTVFLAVAFALLLSSCASGLSLSRFECPEYPMLDEARKVPPYYPHCFLPEGEGAA